MKSEKEKMLNNELYNPFTVDLIQERKNSFNLCFEYNECRPREQDKKNKILQKLIGKLGKNVFVQTPFYCDHGSHITLGDNFHSNHNLVILDENTVEFGDNCLVGPNVSIYTAYHPIDVKIRNSGMEFAKKVKIGNNVFIGGNTTILPGVTIGDNTVIGAGSIVSRSIPDNVVAFGNPCRVKRKIN